MAKKNMTVVIPPSPVGPSPVVPPVMGEIIDSYAEYTNQFQQRSRNKAMEEFDEGAAIWMAPIEFVEHGHLLRDNAFNTSISRRFHIKSWWQPTAPPPEQGMYSDAAHDAWMEDDGHGSRAAFRECEARVRRIISVRKRVKLGYFKEYPPQVVGPALAGSPDDVGCYLMYYCADGGVFIYTQLVEDVTQRPKTKKSGK